MLNKRLSQDTCNDVYIVQWTLTTCCRTLSQDTYMCSEHWQLAVEHCHKDTCMRSEHWQLAVEHCHKDTCMCSEHLQLAVQHCHKDTCMYSEHWQLAVEHCHKDTCTQCTPTACCRTDCHKTHIYSAHQQHTVQQTVTKTHECTVNTDNLLDNRLSQRRMNVQWTLTTCWTTDCHKDTRSAMQASSIQNDRLSQSQRFHLTGSFLLSAW